MGNNTLYPYPVYEAHFADNTVARISFWQQAGSPWDFARGRNMLARIYGKPVAGGFVEYDNPADNWLRVPDTMSEPAKAKRGPTAAHLKKLLADVLDGDSQAINRARELLAA